ncbi:MAG: hypothetical protein KDB69_10065, partial [Acidimicrobiia bacterium]|nr:hypothetical protein [Acidimicrobiia bacterium]
HPDIHLSGGVAAVEYFTRSTIDELITGATAQSNAMWPVIDRVTRLHLVEKDPIVFDWWLLDPATISRIDDARIASVWLTIDDEYLRERERRVNWDFYSRSPDPELMLDRFMARSVWRNDIAARAADFGLPVIDVTGKAVADVTAKVLDQIIVAR